MMRTVVLILTLILPLGACDWQPDPEVVARECEQRARAAQGPTGSVRLGVNSNSGPFTGFEVGVNSDFLRGLDPIAVYERCVYDRTGAMPVRPPALRNL